MSFTYLSQGFSIYPHRQVITQGGETIPVRPKTFALLLLLLENPFKILSKQYLLDTIWDDVTVEEQVLVQSIRELRQLFGNAGVIQTYPRKGYAWATDVEKQSVSGEKPTPEAVAPLDIQQLPAPVISQTYHHGWRFYVIASLVIALLVLAASIVYVLSNPSATSQTQVVVILPVKSQIPGNDHNWVSLGAMDQLINSLGSDQQVQVMDTEYVLHLMQYAHMPRHYDTAQVAHLFTLSGATLIVESQLTGSVEDYQLEYKLRFKNAIKRGVIVDKSLNNIIRQLSEAIVSQTGQHPHNTDANAQNLFNNELMARALEEVEKNNHELALSLLTSVKQLEPNNLFARQLLAHLLARVGRPEQAKTEINAAIAVAKLAHSPVEARLYFSLAQTYFNQQLLEETLLTLAQADKLARQNNDVLYLAYNAQLRGRTQEQQKAYAEAQQSYEQAMHFHSIIRCPIGMSITHLQLTTLLSLQGKNSSAMEHYAKAKNLIEKHQLNGLATALIDTKPKNI